MEYCTVFCTVGNMDNARAIASELVDRRLAACVNIIPGVESIYEWKGQIQYDKELLLIIKSRMDKFDEIKKVIQSLHEYELPEIIALPIENGEKGYLKWIDAYVND
ncbi:MAG: divalent-cation tolerance protein CutA [Calditrichia bacterium]